jgi:hypothetical protein
VGDDFHLIVANITSLSLGGTRWVAQIYRARSVERGDLFMKVACVIGGRTGTPARFPRPGTPVEDMACTNKKQREAASTSLNEASAQRPSVRALRAPVRSVMYRTSGVC